MVCNVFLSELTVRNSCFLFLLSAYCCKHGSKWENSQKAFIGAFFEGIGILFIAVHISQRVTLWWHLTNE